MVPVIDVASTSTFLDPKDMEIKFDKPRDVAVPHSLMEELWAYTLFERNRLAGTQVRRELILTVNGICYGKDSAVKVFKHLSNRVGFKITPLMLRHEKRQAQRRAAT